MLLLKSVFFGLIACFAGVAGATGSFADDRFIDGFPDVPYLDIISTIVGEPVVFDTPSGTVAEVGILFSVSESDVFNTYSNALEGLGWGCNKTPSAINCIRDNSVVQLTSHLNSSTGAAFILRLEPRE